MVQDREPVRFDVAGSTAFAFAERFAAEVPALLVVRDVLGRFTFIADDSEGSSLGAWREKKEKELRKDLGHYAAEQPLLLSSELIGPGELLESDRIVVISPATVRENFASFRFLDNTVVGEDWSQVSPVDSRSNGSQASRTALYGFKGGVGRTTATAILAQHLVDQGLVVLVVDLDLESPGIGPLLRAGAALPRYGIVDHLVESAVGNEHGLDLVSRTGYIPQRGNGELWIAPSRGRGSDKAPYSYVDKLNRVYSDIAGIDFAGRLEAAVLACENAVKSNGDSDKGPDVVLLDSRAGIHDIAAVAISKLSDLTLLFAADNSQTWTGYGDLFSTWNSTGQARAIREKLRMVASMVPASPLRPKEEYLRSFLERSWECFSILYDDDMPVPSTGHLDPDAFSPPQEDESAPHFPIPILFEPGLVGLDAESTPGWHEHPFVQAAYQYFLEPASGLITSNLQTKGNRS